MFIFNSHHNFFYLIRTLSYLLIAVGCFYLFKTEQIDLEIISLILLIFCCVAYPQLSHLFLCLAKSKFKGFLSQLYLVLDSLVVGMLINAMDFDANFILLLFLPVSFFAVISGGILLFIICVTGTLCSANISFHIFTVLNLTFDPIFMLFVNLIILLIVALVGFYVRFQYYKMDNTNKKLRQEQNRNLELSKQLAKYLPKQVWQMIFSGKEFDFSRPTRKKLTVFFADIQGFTMLSEMLEPEDLTFILNSYLNEVTQIAQKYGGTVDQFVGDAVMIFFGDSPKLNLTDAALNAIKMALEIRKQMHVLRQKWTKYGISNPLNIRMGINTGICSIGNFGTSQRMQYTIIGREVNLASRLESNCTAGEILVSKKTYDLIKHKVMCLDKGSITVKGFSHPVEIYEVVDFRESLGNDSDYLDINLPGFSLSLDFQKINHQEHDKIFHSLRKVVDALKT